MKLSTRSRYGTRLMLDLAIHHGKKPVLLKDVAKHQEISEKYLSQIMIPLMKKGLVLSSRGNPRGYTLSKDPENITVLEIVEILEDGLSPLECLTNPKVCGKTETCVTRKVWAKLESAMRDALRSVTLQDLVNDVGNYKNTGSMYHI